MFAMFDLPVYDKEDKKEYVKFRKLLLKQGFDMFQFSVYGRFCESEEVADKFRRHIKRHLPPKGEVRLLAVTDKQFGKMQVFRGKKRRDVEPEPQLSLFF